MSARAIVSGSIHGPIERRVSKTGNAYVLVTIREGDGDAVRWWAAFGFSEPVIAELERLSPGDQLAVSGEIDVGIWTPKDRGPRLSLKITADRVLSLSRNTAGTHRQVREPANG